LLGHPQELRLSVPFKDLDWEGMDPPGPMTESARESGFDTDVNEDELGYSDELENDVTDNAGDIADEGPGHRA
jgi:hypothetical protein